MTRSFWIFLLMLVPATMLWGQSQKPIAKDSLFAYFGTGVTASDTDFLPFYMVHNRWGEVPTDPGLFAEGGLHYQRALSKNLMLSTGFSFRNELFSSYYLDARYQFLYARIGAYQERIGGIDSELTVSNFGLSANARPAPMVEAGIEHFTPLPFWDGLIEIKGRMGLRWLENDRYMANALLHNKDAAIRLNLEKYIGFNISSGFYHFAQFGGVSPEGIQQPNAFSDFWTVFRGAGIPNPDGTNAGEANGLGNHLGMFELTFDTQIKEHKLILNYQSPFEDNGSMQYISLQDFSLALHWELPKKAKGLQSLQLEYMQTKMQSGPGIPDGIPQFPDKEANYGYDFGGRDNLHNNWLYRSGYTYQDLIMGNPLFLTANWTSLFMENLPTYGVNVVSNRTQAWNLSARGELAKGISYFTRFTYSMNWGTYAGLFDGRFNWGGIAVDPNFDYAFRGGREQFYSYMELNFEQPLADYPFDFRIVFAHDFGELYQNNGVELAIRYVLRKH